MEINKVILESFSGVGKHNNIKDSNFSEEQLKRGIEIEKEHSNNINVRKAIAKDHLSETPNYYTYLGKMEQFAKSKLKRSDIKLKEND